MAARSKAWVCGRSLAGIAGSNPAGGMHVCREYCVLSGRGLCYGLITRPEECYRVCVSVSVIRCNNNPVHIQWVGRRGQYEEAERRKKDNEIYYFDKGQNYSDVREYILLVIQLVVQRLNEKGMAESTPNCYYYRYSALGPVRAETRAQSGDWCDSGKLHPGQILRGSLPLLSPAYRLPHFSHQLPPHLPRRERSPAADGGTVSESVVR
jgi:hypothetical protein